MQKKAFRKVALERLSSPEQLDQLIQITSIRIWQIMAVVGLVLAGAIVWSIFGSITTSVHGNGIIVRDNISYVMNGSSGLLTAWKVNAGDRVNVGDTLATISSPDHADDFKVLSPYVGQVNALKVRQGDYVTAGEPLLEITDGGSVNSTPRLKATMYVSLEQSVQLTPGMDVNLLPAGVRVEESGYLEATIDSISTIPVTEQEVLRRTGSTVLASKLHTSDTLVEVNLLLATTQTNNGNNSAYRWSLLDGAPKSLSHGTLFAGEVITSRQAPINLIFANTLKSVAAATPKATPTSPLSATANATP